MKMLDNKGFGIFEGFLILVIVGIIGGAGYYVYAIQQDTNKTLDTAGNTDASRKENTADNTFKPPSNWKKYENTKYSYSIYYPETLAVRVEGLGDDDLAKSSAVVFDNLVKTEDAAPYVQFLVEGILVPEHINDYEDAAERKKLHAQGLEAVANKSYEINKNDPNPHIKNKNVSKVSKNKRGSVDTYEFTVSGSYSTGLSSGDSKSGFVVDTPARIVFFQTGKSIFRIILQNNSEESINMLNTLSLN